MSHLCDLRAKKKSAADAILKLRDKLNAEGYQETSEDRAAWDAANNDYNAISERLTREERAESISKELSAGDEQRRKDVLPDVTERRKAADPPQVTDETRALAISAWFAEQNGRYITDEQRQACESLKFNYQAKELVIPFAETTDHRKLVQEYRNGGERAAEKVELRTMSAFTGASGAYIKAPTSLIRRLEINMLAFGGVSQVAETITTTTGERMGWPTADDTSNTGALLGESTSIGSSVDPSFAQIYWDAYKFSSKPVLVPYELLEDSVFDIPAMLGDMFGERLGRIQNTYYTTGTGNSQPKGLVTASSLGVTAASATAIAADELIGMVHSIDPAYRGTGCGWMMHDSILLALRKLKDGDGQYLWQAGLNSGAPDSLLSYPVTINQAMQSSVATATKTLLFGQLSKYKIRRVNGVRIYRLQERYRDTDQDGFIALMRADGNLLTAGTAPVKHLLQA